MDRANVFFNEIEPFPAQWLWNLYPEAFVSQSDIQGLNGKDIQDFRRVHLFAGIGGWEYALKLARWPAYRSVWTGSCPCQPFSAAGKGLGESDPRHREWERLRTDAWERHDLIYCSDGKVRRVESADPESEYVKVVDGISGRMGLGGSVRFPETEEEINASQINSRRDQTLCVLPEADGAEAIQRKARGSSNVPSAEVLRPDLQGNLDERSDQESNSAKQSTAVGKGSEESLRGLRTKHHKALRPPSRPQPYEQRSIELFDLLRLLPSSIAFAQLHGDAASAQVLSAVLETDAAQRLLRYSPYEVEETGRSLDRSARERLRDATREARFVVDFGFPLVDGVPNRTHLLRAYGNAIVPQLAAVFIRSVMNSLP